MITVLWISAIGMGLVFLAILLLWGLMALLVRLTAEQAPAAQHEIPVLLAVQPEDEPASAGPEPQADKKRRAAAGPEPQANKKRRAAAAAVAVALALQQRSAGRQGLESGAQVSSWQAVHRAGLFAQRANPARKKVL